MAFKNPQFSDDVIQQGTDPASNAAHKVTARTLWLDTTNNILYERSDDNTGWEKVGGSGGTGADYTPYFNELRSNGILGTASVATSDLLGLTLNIAAHTAYVKGQRFLVASQTLTMPANVTTYVWTSQAGSVTTGAAYPTDLDTIARIAAVTTDAVKITAVVDEHRPLVELDQKVLDIEKTASDHIADATGAHAASAISVSPITGMTAAQVQAAIEELKTMTGLGYGGGAYGGNSVVGRIQVDITAPASLWTGTLTDTNLKSFSSVTFTVNHNGLAAEIEAEILSQADGSLNWRAEAYQLLSSGTFFINYQIS